MAVIIEKTDNSLLNTFKEMLKEKEFSLLT